jgi:hypothetical protein
LWRGWSELELGSLSRGRIVWVKTDNKTPNAMFS